MVPPASSVVGLSLIVVSASIVVGLAHAQTYSATYLPSNAPAQSEQGQSGTNQCGGGSNQNSSCQNAYRTSFPLSLSPLFLSQLISPSHSDTDTDPIIHSQLPRRLVHLRPALPRALIDHRRHGACRSLLVHAIGPRHASHPRRRHLRRALRRHPQLRAGDRRR